MRKKYSRSGKKGFVGLLILFGGLIMLFFRSLASSPTKYPQANQIISSLTGYGIDQQTAKFWAAVSAFETDFWSSHYYTQDNNLFGMQLPTSNTTAVSSDNGFAHFNSTSDSIQDLVLYFQRLHWNQLSFASLYDLVSMMKSKNYFVEPLDDYFNGVTATYQTLFS